MKLRLIALAGFAVVSGASCAPAEGRSDLPNDPDSLGEIIGLRAATGNSFTTTDDGGIISILGQPVLRFGPVADASGEVSLRDVYHVVTDRGGVRVRAYVSGIWDGPAAARPSLMVGPNGATVSLQNFIPAEGSFHGCHDFVLQDPITPFELSREVMRIPGQAGQLELTGLSLQVISPALPAPGPDDCDPPPAAPPLPWN